MPWNNQPRLAVGHDDMSALTCDSETELLKNAHCVLLANSRNLGHNRLNRDEFRGDFLVLLCRIAPDVFLRDFQPQLDGLPDIA
jgi:hypothetical protein